MTTPSHSAETAVLAVLAGAPLGQAAAEASLDPVDLAEAVEAYQAAGRTALQARSQDHGWYQVRVEFTDWNTAEQRVAADLAPAFRRGQQAGVLADWWFIRKHPCWRFRFHPGPRATPARMKAVVGALFDGFVDTGAACRWWETLYEPETFAFGGPSGMRTAHRLFHADSDQLLVSPHSTAGSNHLVGRRELSVLLCSTLFRHARQDAAEQGDVWYRVERMRALPAEVTDEHLEGMIVALPRLIALDLTPTSALVAPAGALGFAAGWLAAFAQAGEALGEAARDGVLRRGIRAVLANHVIFHWNRLGLATRTQAILARAAREALMHPPARPLETEGWC